nr:MAG TPA: hypothetical protein [Caudoviricetes sp.]
MLISIEFTLNGSFLSFFRYMIFFGGNSGNRGNVVDI